MDLKKGDYRIHDIETDILIIGGGMAATMGAIEAKKHNIKVTLVDKGKLGFSGTSPFCGGGTNDWALLPPEFGGDPRDSLETQMYDCVRGGEYINDQAMTEIFSKEALARMVEIEGLGIRFERNSQGKYVSRRLMGFTYPRGGGYPIGKSFGLMQAMRRATLERGVDVLERVMVTRLFTQKGKVIGALGIDTKEGDYYLFKSKATLLAAGSATGIYKYPTCINELTGDAYFMAYEAGATLKNMEFLQFSANPLSREGTHIRTGGLKPLTAGGIRWINSLGERIMEKYDPERLELTHWANNIYAIYAEMKEGRKVYMDMSFVPEKVYDNWEKEGKSGTVGILKTIGIDPRRELVQWIPGLHVFLGGAIINERGETSMPGLYAAGESAGHGGIFGADRVGGGIPAAQVLGHRAGKYAAEYAQGTKDEEPLLDKKDIEAEIQRIESLKKGGKNPFDTEKGIKEIAFETLSIERNDKGLRKAIEEYSRMRREGFSALGAQNMYELIKAIEVYNLVLTGEMVSLAALERKESRGQHRREDYPQKNDNEFVCWFTIRRDEKGEMKIDKIPVPMEKYPIKI